jgi:hypothetical protein
MARHQAGVPVRITTANASREEDIAARQKRYLLAMGFRTVCFVAAIFVPTGWLRVVLIVAALVLPYVAVVMANSSDTRADGFELRDGEYDRPELTARAEPEGRPGSPGS